MENHFNLCCLAMTMSRVYALHRETVPKRRHPNRRTGAFAFADVRRAIAAELRSGSIIYMGCPESVKRAIKIVRDTLFNRVA